MTVDIFALCDFAQDNNGKLTIVGVYNSILVKKTPFTRSMYLVARLYFDRNEVGKSHKIKISIIDEKNQSPLIKPIENELPLEDGKEGVFCNLIFELGNFAFPSDGIYNFKLSVDDKERSLSLNVRFAN